MELILPDFPPASPWQAYVWYIAFLPFIFRVILVSRPLVKVVRIFAPHSGWAIKQIKDLPVKGVGLLLFNEILAFTLPPLLVIVIRLLVDPLGWQSWSEVNATGLVLLLSAFLVWVYFDLLRVFRVRNMLNAVLEKDIGKLRKRAGFALGIRKGLLKFGRGSDEKVKSFTEAAKEGEAAGKVVNKGVIGAVAGIATEAVRRGATALVEKVDSTIENKFEVAVAEYNQNLIMILLRDIAMSAGPLLILTLIPTIAT
jgi:hypothetical protein